MYIQISCFSNIEGICKMIRLRRLFRINHNLCLLIIIIQFFFIDVKYVLATNINWLPNADIFSISQKNFNLNKVLNSFKQILIAFY